MKRTKYLTIHAIQTGIYSILLLLMTFIKDKYIDNKVFMAFYGFLTIAVMVCGLVAIIAMCIRGDDDEE